MVDPAAMERALLKLLSEAEFEELLKSDMCKAGGVERAGFGAAIRMARNGQKPKKVPPLPQGKQHLDVGKRDNCLAEMCARTTELKVVVGGHWTDDMAKRALAPLFEPRAAPPSAPPAAALAGGTSAAAAQSPKRATTRESIRNRSPDDGLAPKYAY